MKKDHFVTSSFINLRRANNTHLMAVEQKMIFGLEKVSRFYINIPSYFFLTFFPPLRRK